MGIIVFWSVIALVYFVLAVVTGIALYKLRQDLSELDKMSPSGIFNKNGRVVAVESTLYNSIKAILFADVVGFILATIAAIVSSVITGH
jgi:hypothetical protein